MVQGSAEVSKQLGEVRINTLGGEMDSSGHINNIYYFRYCEEARVRFLRPLGHLRHGQPSGPVIVASTCDFLVVIVYPAELIVILHGGAPSRSSFTSCYEIRDSTDESKLYARASARIVWVDYKAGKSTALPDSIRQCLPAAEARASTESR